LKALESTNREITEIFLCEIDVFRQEKSDIICYIPDISDDV